MIGFDDIEYASLSDVGIRRSHNQDAHANLTATDASQWDQRGHVFLVADGMGAHAVGELASKLAVDSIPHIYSKYSGDGPIAALKRAFTEANVTINNRGQQNPEFEGMGTTATAILLRPEGAWIGHVGDSRAYRVRGGKIEQLTFDHSLVWELARRQNRDPEEVQRLQHVPSNVIIRSLGPEPAVQVDVDGPYPMQPGDTYVVCSDGLSGQVTDREIGAVAHVLSPEEACRFLINLANLQGGPDNITVTVVRVKGEPPPASGDSQDVQKPRLGDPRPLRTFLRKAPWPLALLLTGITLAGLAILLTYNKVSGDLPTFLIAAVALVGGLVGLMAQNYWESNEAEEPAPSGPPKIHRVAECGISTLLVQRLEQALAVLVERIKERQWEADWDACEKHSQEAQARLQQGNQEEGFREMCRAMLCLMDAVGQQRHREETFKPLWDRAPV